MQCNASFTCSTNKQTQTANHDVYTNHSLLQMLNREDSKLRTTSRAGVRQKSSPKQMTRHKNLESVAASMYPYAIISQAEYHNHHRHQHRQHNVAITGIIISRLAIHRALLSPSPHAVLYGPTYAANASQILLCRPLMHCQFNHCIIICDHTVKLTNLQRLLVAVSVLPCAHG